MFREYLTLFPRESQMRVELDKRALFALASDTRLDILRALQPMRRTVTQLADSLGIDKAAVYRHLKTLEEGGFVKRYEDHGFVYYGLSWKARDIMSPNENTKIIITLSASWMLIVLVIFIAIAAMTTSSGILFWDDSRSETSPTGGYDGEPADGGTDESLVGTFTATALWLLPALSILVIALALIIVAFRRIRRPKQRTALVNETPIPEGESS